MRIAVFSTKPYDRRFFESANAEFGHELHFFEPRLTHETLPLATGFPGVCVFVNDVLDATVLQQLANEGLRLVALRCAGFNNVDVPTADQLGVTVVRVPAYSPHAVAEHTVGMMLSLNRKLHRAYGRVRESNFALDGLLGFDMNGRTVGLIGTGKIGLVTAGILKGFGCRLLAYDLYPNDQLSAMGGQYVDLPEIYAEADIISLHCPLTAETHHLIDEQAVNQMKPGVMLVNTSRGAIIDTRAAIEGLKSGKIGALGIDVYEEESELFFEDHSDQVLVDDVFARLLTFPNVLITGHQAFFTREALEQIARTTLSNVTLVDQDAPCPNQVTLG
ncbi:MAG: 2-hydroxyacid dehydrogenase [Planctomycetales bacterium]|nr:2-hydroxyacid dehydrogenase [Planctomycetales bacterium]